MAQSNVGLNAKVVLTFSKSLAAGTINYQNFGLLVNGSLIGIGVSSSPDNRVVTLSPLILPASSTVTVVASGSVTDLSGNHLPDFQSQFTTAAAFDIAHPTVVAQHPANGAQAVPANANVVLYLSEPMNAASVQGAFYVAVNGSLVSGTTQVTNNGQVVQFTPSTAWPPNTLVQVFLDSSAQDVDGNSASTYQGSFTTAVDASTVTPSATGTNPTSSATAVPTNTVIDFAFSQPLDPTSVNTGSVQCRQNNTWFQTSISLIGGGSVIHIVPRSLLPANTSISCQVSTGVRGVNGLPSYGNNLTFTTGASPDTVMPAIVSISPPSGSTNVGDNADVRVVFSKPVNPLSVNAGTIQISTGGVSVMPDTITISYDKLSVLLVPHSPLPDATQMALTISGVTDAVGNAVPPQTTQFTTGTGPDVISPTAVRTSPFFGATNVPTNALIIVQANEPLDPGSINSTSFMIIDDPSGQNVPGTYSLSLDGQTVTFVPNPPLASNRGYHVYFASRGITDLSQNPLQATSTVSDFIFTTGNAANTGAPQVLGVSPANGLSGVPVNSQVAIQFNEPVDAATLSQVKLTVGSTTVNVTKTLTYGNQLLTLVPVLPLNTGTTYTVSIAGVWDLSGNPLGTPVTTTFTTGTQADLIAPQVVSISPASNSTGVPANTAVQVQFNEPIDPLTVTSSTFILLPQNQQVPLAGTITVSQDRLSATFTPSAPLGLLTSYIVQVTNGVTDVAGLSLGYYQTYFTTGTSGGGGSPSIATINPASGNAGGTTTIYGSHFGTSQGTGTVTFNGLNAAATSWSDTQIVASVPAGAVTGPVVVTVNGVASNGPIYTVTFTPTITSISPSPGPAGTTVTLTGTNFGSPFDSTRVVFNSSIYPPPPITPLSWTETSISVVLPSTALTGNVFVTTSGSQSAGYSYTVLPTPIVSSLTPSSGVAGMQVNIYGNHFGATQGTNTLSFNGVPPASISTWSDTYILATLPSNATTGPVTVVASSIPSNSSVVFTVTNPAIGSVSPPAAAVGATVTLNGSGLSTQGLPTQISFNGTVVSVTQTSSSSIIVPVPSGATSGPLTVTVGSVTSNSVQFTVEQPPAVTGVSPASGTVGSWPVIISGSGFGATQSNSSVNFSGDVPAAIISWSDTEIHAIVPDGATTGPVAVLVGSLEADGPSFQINALVQITDSLGNASSYTSAISGGNWVLTNAQGPGCKSCTTRGDLQNSVDGLGNILSTTDANSHVRSFTYDPSNNMTSSSAQLDANNTATTSYTYNSLGEVLTMTDALGHTTTNTYDANGNLLTVTSPAPNGSTPASVTQFTYDTKGELKQITDPLSHVTTLAYTAAGLIQSITDAQQHVTSYQYDARGNRTSVTDALQHQTTFAYDAGNRLTGITYPGGSTVGFTYDTRGRRTSVTDQTGKTTTYTYDDADRLTAVTDAASNATQYAYDNENNLLSITDANGHVTSFNYNSRGWVTQTSFPSSHAEVYDYDAVGNLTSKLDRKGQTITYVYDALNRLTHKGYPDSTGVDYIYDLVGKIQQVNDPTGSYGFAYDNMGRLIGTTTQYSFLPTATYTNTYSLRCSVKPDGADGAGWQHQHLRLRHPEPAEQPEQFADRTIRLRLRCPEPENPTDASEWSEHKLLV